MEELERLVERARGGDLDAFGRIVSRFQDMAYGCAYAVVGDFHLAQDVAQEAFLEAYRSLDNLRETKAFPGWFRRIVLHSCNRLTRRRQPEAVGVERMEAMPSASEEPAEELARHEMKENVLAAIKALPERERMVTTLFYINGYSQEDIAGFLEVPVATVKSRLHTSRGRLKERMMNMVEQTLKEHAPDERFSRKVIDELLGRAKPLEIEGHPVRQIWELIRAALPEYKVVSGPEIEDKEGFEGLQENMERAYHVDSRRALRTQMTLTTFKAVQGQVPPVRLLAAGRVFRPDPEDARHLKVFHQVDGIAIEPGANAAALRVTCERILKATLGQHAVKWRAADFAFVDHGLEMVANLGGKWEDISGCGLLKPETLREAGYNPEAVHGYAFGIGLERLAMLMFGIDDIRTLWQPPYVTK